MIPESTGVSEGMGHARVNNISTRFNRLLHQKPTSIRECVDVLERANQCVHASEGNLPERYMLSAALQYIVDELLALDAIEPYELTPIQKRLLTAWRNDDNSVGDWDSGDDGDGGEYGIFDSIRWKAKRKRLPIIHEWET